MFDIDLDRHGSNIALVEDGRKVDYATLEKDISIFSKSLPQEKQLVIFCIEPTVQNIVAYLSFIRNNHAVLMVDSGIDDDLKQALYRKYKPNFIYQNEKLIPYSKNKIEMYDELSLLLPTSGSTGSSKYVKLTKANLYANADSICRYLPIGDKDSVITSLPLHYSYGLSVLHTHLLKGATIVLSGYSIMQKEFWELFKKENVTNFNGVPYHYEMLYRLKFDFRDYPSIRFATQAGGKLNEKYIKHFATMALDRDVRFFVMYGQTEATARISYVPPDRLLSKINSIGIAIFGGEISFVDEELVYRGKNVMLGYASSDKDLAKGDELKGVLHTGDIGYMDEDGFSYIVARAKRFVKMFGNRINLDECEHFIKSNYKDVYLVGKENHITVFSLHDDDEAVKLLKDRYKISHKAISLRKIDKFPTKTTGKIDYQKLYGIAYG
ncbi:MAG: AMP-binding protein [Epsilonproteobacteria bacterium]|nr:AMP-binding protein [Campylobacterota bacterium]